MPDGGEQVFWRATTRRHDWASGDFVSRLLAAAADLGLVGPSTWRRAGIAGEQEPTAGEPPAELATHLPAPGPDEPEAGVVECGGDEPFAWSATVSVAVPGARRPPPSTVSIWSDWEWVRRTGRASDRLAAAFAGVHSPADTEYAFVHPYSRWLDLSAGAYRRPVTSGPTFRGVCWLTFLGPGQIEEFQADRLGHLDGAELRWAGGEGLLVRATRELSEAATPAGEERLVGLTEAFRQALRPDSRWR
ncbi:MAG TPA: hypothetical protein VFJ85_02035 [Acidimicrobiales bacterium]|nr:hypothetical protein [Acidimicrobiales bacterium]